MKNSAIERTLYLNILQAVGVPISDINYFEDGKERYWPAESSDSSLQAPDEPETSTEREPKPIMSPLRYSSSSQKEPDTSRSAMLTVPDNQPGEADVAKANILPHDLSPNVETSAPLEEHRDLGNLPIWSTIPAVDLHHPSSQSKYQAPIQFGQSLTHASHNTDPEFPQNPRHSGFVDLETPLQPASSSPAPSVNETGLHMKEPSNRTGAPNHAHNC